MPLKGTMADFRKAKDIRAYVLPSKPTNRAYALPSRQNPKLQRKDQVFKKAVKHGDQL